jgi:predicted transcriptional regulator
MGKHVTEADRVAMRELRSSGLSDQAIADKLGRSRSVVRYTLNPVRREKEQKRLRDTMRSRQGFSGTADEYIKSAKTTRFQLSEPVTVHLRTSIGYLYKLFAVDNTCLYVGKTQQAHPAFRIACHQTKDWWSEVAYVEYVEVLSGDLSDAEYAMIQVLNPAHNIHHKIV